MPPPKNQPATPHARLMAMVAGLAAGLFKPAVTVVTPTAPVKTIKPFKDPELPTSDNKTLAPSYLLGHQNRFDPNTYTPEGVLRTKTGMVSPGTIKTTT